VSRALAIETSGRSGSVALVDAGRVVAEESFSADMKHAAGVIAVIDRLTGAHGWRPKDLDEVYVSAGPGSFTGLRVGVTVAKTLAFALGCRLVAVPSTAVLARNAPGEARQTIIVLDAKRGQIFTARYAPDGTGITEVEAPHLDTLAAMLERAPRPVHLIGEGIPYHRAAVAADDPSIVVTDEGVWAARAAAVAEIGRAMALRGEFTDADRLTPIYIRRPEAEEKWEQRHPA
jgi:tRNA threonylcarbamoyladenosine biosynthesis protein TsaB